MMPRVLVVTEVGDAWPSGLLRGLAYRDLFARNGVEVQYVSRLSPMLERAQGRLGGMARGLGRLNRLIGVANDRRIVRLARHVDTVYLLKVTSFELVTQLRARTGARLVFDLNDALWLPSFAGFVNGRLTDVLSQVDAIVTDNSHGISVARRHNPNVWLVPDPPQVELFDERRSVNTRRGDETVLGWVGSAGTAFNLFRIWEPLERLFAQHANLRLRLVGVGRRSPTIPRFERVRYSTVAEYTQSTMINEVLGMDIGLFPLFDVEDSRARGVLKATVYMSGGAAAVCSAVGSCRELIVDGVNGMLASSAAEWYEKLDRLVSDRALRERLAHTGLDMVRREFSLDRCFASLLRALLPAATGTPG